VNHKRITLFAQRKSPEFGLKFPELGPDLGPELGTELAPELELELELEPEPEPFRTMGLRRSSFLTSEASWEVAGAVLTGLGAAR
jgi:hypothetical protein